jgi:hypothetical protein
MKALPVVSVFALALAALCACSTSKAGKEEPVTQPQGATSAVATAEGAAPAPAPSPAILGKPQAPVDIQASLAQGAATVRLKFHQAGAHVTVRVSGVDGLGLRGAETLATGLAVAAGEEKSFDVALTPGPGQGLLAVQVSGTFAAGERHATRAFPVGTASPEQLKAKSQTTDVGGERIKLMEAGEKK